MVLSFYIHPNNVQEFQFLYILTNTWYGQLFKVLAILIFIQWYLIVVLLSISLINDVEHLYMCLFYHPLVKCSNPWTILKLGCLLVFLLMKIDSSFYTLNSRPLQICPSFFEVVLATLVYLHFHMNFIINLSVSTKNMVEFWLRLCGVYRSTWGKLTFLNVESSNPWILCISPFIIILFNFSDQSLLVFSVQVFHIFVSFISIYLTFLIILSIDF